MSTWKGPSQFQRLQFNNSKMLYEKFYQKKLKEACSNIYKPVTKIQCKLFPTIIDGYPIQDQLIRRNMSICHYIIEDRGKIQEKHKRQSTS